MIYNLGIINNKFAIKAFISIGLCGKWDIMDSAVVFHLCPGLPSGDHAAGHAGFNQFAGYFAELIPGYGLCL